jgi:molybdopterin-guanine dinucleotide biosynthesis protein A
LAGGSSRRMGRSKALLERRGEVLVSERVACLSAVVDRVAVLVGEQREQLRGHCRGAQLVDDPGLGPAQALRCAMKELGAPLLVIAVDMPNLTQALLRAFLAAAGDGAVLGPHPNPLPALLPRAFADQTSRRLVTCVDALGLPRIELAQLGEFNPEDLLDTNVPEDWAIRRDD